MIARDFLTTEYLEKKRSARDIAVELKCSENKVTYWLHKHNISKRTISDAIYAKSNPKGNPFCKKELRTNEEWFLYGLGLGLYWGEGTKSNKYSIRLGNTDPALVKKFILFLENIYAIDRTKLRFGLQIFSDMSKDSALQFWIKELDVSRKQFQKLVVTRSGSIGNYRNKTKHGVLTVHFNNKKLRDIIVGAIEGLQLD